MRAIRSFVWRLGSGFSSQRAARKDLEFAEEIEFHLQMQIADNLLNGMTPAEARRVALVKSGGLESAREAYRDRGGFPVLEAVRRDFRYALRMLRKSPVFTAAIVVTLAVGIGANTALFSLLDAVLLRPLPYPQPDQLMVLGSDAAMSHGVLLSYPNYLDLKQRTQVFSDLATCTRDSPVTLTGPDAPERVDAAQATANLFTVLGIAPLMGRGFSEQEADQEQPVTVISFGMWQRWFAGSQDVLGQTLTMDGSPTRVIGVMPRSFQFPTPLIQLWRPVNKGAHARSRPFGLLIGRLRPDASLARAREEMATINLGVPGAYLIPMRQQIAGKGVRVALWSLFGAVCFVMLIACANVSNLLLARGMVRQHELAIRAAMGASRRRLLGQLMVENAMLCSLSAVLGVLLAFFALRALVAFAPTGTPRLEDVGIDTRVLGFTLLMSCLCTLLFGLLPALQITRSDPQETLKAGGSNPLRRPPGRREGNALIIGELALAMVLLCGAGLTLRSLVFVHRVPLGFDPRNTLTFRVVLPYDWDSAQQTDFYSAALRRIRRLPGVEQAGTISNLSLNFTRPIPITPEGGGPQNCGESVMEDSASADFFSTLGVGVRSGRPFSIRDNGNAQPVALINETLAGRCWPHDDATGKGFRLADGRLITVVGIVGDMRRNGIDRDGVAQVFLPLEQRPIGQADFVVRSSNAANTLASTIRHDLATIDPHVPVFRVSTLTERLATEQIPRRFETGLLSLFALVALFLAAVGIYGVMHYSVAQRTNEIGIRMATGARPSNVLTMILGQGCRLASVGLAAGIVGSLLLSRLFTSLPLFGVTATDPLTFVVAVILLGAVVVLACCIPAWQAASVNPLMALRHE